MTGTAKARFDDEESQEERTASLFCPHKLKNTRSGNRVSIGEWRHAARERERERKMGRKERGEQKAGKMGKKRQK